MMPILVPMPDHPYYLWQALVQSHALKKAGFEARHLVYTNKSGPPSPTLRKMLDAKALTATVWNDWRTKAETVYNPAMKPWLVGRWLEAHPEWVQEPFMLIDPDAIPLHKRFPRPTENRWYASDTDDYTGSEYLRSKGDGLKEALGRLAGVEPEQAETYTGAGAQLTVVGQDHEFWYSVAANSIEAYRVMEDFKAKHPEIEEPVQSWCAEMYMTQLELIKRGVELRPVPSMSMVWAGDPADKLEGAGFYHNAGVVSSEDGHFAKTEHQKSPFKAEITAKRSSASKFYVELIKETAEAYPDLIW